MAVFDLLSVETLLNILPEPIRGLVPRPRHVRDCPGGVRVELRHIGGPGTEREARALEERLLAMGMARAEVNGTLGSVFVSCEAGTDRDKLLAVIEEYDRDGGTAGVARALDGMEQQARAAASLALNLVGTGLAATGRLARVSMLPMVVPAFLAAVDETPRLRHEVERRLGKPVADTVLATGRIVSTTLAARPVSMLIDSAAAMSRYLAMRAGARAWADREEELAALAGTYRNIPVRELPRPIPLARGPVERYADLAGATALAVYTVTATVGGDHEKGLSLLIGGMPKATRICRDAFISGLVRALSARGAIVLDLYALHRMDRVDTVVIDATALMTGAWTIDDVHTLLTDVDLDDLHARLYTLLDLMDPSARREHDGWTAAPWDASDGPAPPEHWQEKGSRAVVVSHQGTEVALVGLARELHPMAEALVAAPKDACEVILAGGEPGLALRLGVDRTVEGGSRLVTSVRELQLEGRGVALVSQRSRRGLTHADLAIGVLDRSRRIPWDADVMGELDGVHLLLRNLPMARRVSARGAWVAATGAVFGTGLSFAGPAPTVVRRAQVVRDCTSAVAFVVGHWAGRVVGRGAPPIYADTTPWHAMAARDVLARLETSPNGLTEAEAAGRRVKTERRDEFHPKSLLGAALEELANPLTPVLGAAAGVSALVGSAVDALLIGGVLGVDALLGGAQRRGADRVLHRLTEATAVTARLRRPGGVEEVLADDLVPGDVIELRAGDAVPADARLIKASGLEVDESTLTGESQLVAKTTAPTAAAAVAERSSMVYLGTTVAAGSARAVVVATGDLTEAGRTARLARQEAPLSGVELRLRALSRRILPAAVGSGVLLMGIDLVRGTPLATALGPAVSMMVAAVPEGLPFVATVAELASAKRLAKHNTLVRNPSTIEALGRVDVLCFDKTGTLTEGHISLGQVSDGWCEQPLAESKPEMRAIVAGALRAGPRFGGGRVIAHPTDRAVVEGAQSVGVSPDEGLTEWRRVDELHFEPARGYHAVLGLSGAGHLLSVKGAPEVVLGRCTSLVRDGRTVPLDDAIMGELEQEVDRLARRGYRVLAVAERPASSRADLDEDRIERLSFLGFLGLADPVRPTAKRSVEQLVRAGVRVVMITGDHPSTAEAIAAEINAVNGLRVMTGPEIDRLDDDALAEVLPQVAVFARTTPEHKARIVTVLRGTGRVVAVTGDGANDVPAIRLADVGVALGARATPAARSAADIVVADDRIETIIDAIVEGRAMWGSVRDSLGILLGGNVGEIVFTLGSSLLTRRSALNARQLLLVNLLTDMLPAMAVAVRPPSAASPEKLLAEGPEASLGAALTRDIYVRAIATAGGAIAAWTFARVTGTRGRADTVGLIGLVAAQLLQTLALGHRDRTVVLASLSSLAALGLIISIPGVSQVFGSRPVGPVGWGIGLGCGAVAAVVAGLIEKAVAG
ncbi:cation-translocating P-type ATPase [Nonomuraea cavernae]|uniref:Haloacid dehalogenase n=1 Tax=Nonomuraea cavernae TaxID=2045107 RepID=A0A917YQ63_9ACTN|nr:cation-translocating P-type ATPase [Nonomuraea cavernae]MCA2183671.1 cation-translocating P-type ATPase [Nonomuraea cavernae]GGO61012.1 haloacid dehalogenase [Nonomuraea cavernae]